MSIAICETQWRLRQAACQTVVLGLITKAERDVIQSGKDLDCHLFPLQIIFVPTYLKCLLKKNNENNNTCRFCFAFFPYPCLDAGVLNQTEETEDSQQGEVRVGKHCQLTAFSAWVVMDAFYYFRRQRQLRWRTAIPRFLRV